MRSRRAALRYLLCCVAGTLCAFVAGDALGEHYAAGTGAIPQSGWRAIVSRGSVAASFPTPNGKIPLWTTEGPQQAGDWFAVDLGMCQKINHIVLDTADSSGQYPGKYMLLVSTDGWNWGNSVASGVGSPATTIRFERTPVRYFKVILLGNGSRPWSIAHIRVYNDPQWLKIVGCA